VFWVRGLDADRFVGIMLFIATVADRDIHGMQHAIILCTIRCYLPCALGEFVVFGKINRSERVFSFEGAQQRYNVGE